MTTVLTLDPLLQDRATRTPTPATRFGADTMRIEVFTDDGWQPLDGGEA